MNERNLKNHIPKDLYRISQRPCWRQSLRFAAAFIGVVYVSCGILGSVITKTLGFSEAHLKIFEIHHHAFQNTYWMRGFAYACPINDAVICWTRFHHCLAFLSGLGIYLTESQ